MQSPTGLNRLVIRPKKVGVVGCVETFVARLRIKIFIISEPSDYIIYSQQTGHKTIIRAGGSTE